MRSLGPSRQESNFDFDPPPASWSASLDQSHAAVPRDAYQRSYSIDRYSFFRYFYNILTASHVRCEVHEYLVILHGILRIPQFTMLV